MESRGVHILILSTADWQSPLWTNKQYLAKFLAEAGVQVTYCESLGLRRPSFVGADKRRLISRLTARFSARGGAYGPSGSDVRVIPVIAVPAAYRAWARWANPMLLRIQLRDWRRSRSRVLWTFSPVTFGLQHHAHATIYHAVDLLHELPGVDPRTITFAERQLSTERIAAVASSRTVREHLIGAGFRDPLLWPNVADVATYRRPSEAADSPRVGDHAIFAGNLTSAKIDWRLLSLTADHPGVTLHLAGTVELESGRTPTALGQLLERENVIYHDVLRPPELALLFSRCKVGLIPYLDNPYTRGVYPIKLHEYQAAGLAVLTSRLDALRDLELPAADYQVRGASDWRAGLSVLFANASRDDVARRTQLATSLHSWAQRTQEVLRLIDEMRVPV